MYVVYNCIYDLFSWKLDVSLLLGFSERKIYIFQQNSLLAPYSTTPHWIALHCTSMHVLHYPRQHYPAPHFPAPHFPAALYICSPLYCSQPSNLFLTKPGNKRRNGKFKGLEGNHVSAEWHKSQHITYLICSRLFVASLSMAHQKSPTEKV